MTREFLEKLLRREDLARAEASSLMMRIMDGELTDVQIAGILIAMRAKGATVDEIAGFAGTMRERALQVWPQKGDLVDTCGTGGDGSGTFNISTAAALVAAGAGVGVAKHGNRAMSSQCGSSDVLDALGVALVPPDRVAEVIDRVGIGFMFAPAHHPATKHAVKARQELGVRTLFNLLGPMTNPALVKRQLMGIFDPDATETAAEVLRSLGSEMAYVVHGHDGADEVSIVTDTRVTRLEGDMIETSTFSPESVGLERADARDIAGGTPDENAAMIQAVISGEPGARRNAVVLNAGFVIHAAGREGSIEAGVRAAEAAIDSGATRAVLDNLRAVTAELAAEA